MKSKYESVLKLFCGTDDFRIEMHKPFIQDGKYISTNAHVLCSIPVGFAELDFLPQDSPNCKEALTYDMPFSRKTSVSELKGVIDKYAKKIPEYKHPPKECNNCNGDGYLMCDLDHDHECDACYGSGEIEGKIPTGNMLPDPKSTLGMWGSYIMVDKLQLLFNACDILGVEKLEEVSAGVKHRFTFLMGDFNVLIMGCMYVEENCVETDLV